MAHDLPIEARLALLSAAQIHADHIATIARQVVAEYASEPTRLCVHLGCVTLDDLAYMARQAGAIVNEPAPYGYGWDVLPSVTLRLGALEVHAQSSRPATREERAKYWTWRTGDGHDGAA